MFKRRIIFTGGGSAGHVTANLILISRLLQEQWEIHYIGSKHGIERQLIGKIPAVHYHAVATGKLRRYWAWANISDVFKIILGVLQAYLLILRIKPHVCFSLGGFVAVPAVVGAGWNRVPVLILEPDLHPGLANRLSRRYAQMMCTTFMDTATFASSKASDKTMYVGPVIREELKLGSRARGIHFCRFVSDRPILLIMGGSQGSEKLNQMVLETLPELLKRYQIIHICGTGKLNSSFPHFAGYKAFEYVHEELADLMVMADIVVSRAGSNAIHEWLLLRKPMLLIPHANGGSLVGQTLNAKYFQERGYARVLQEEELSSQTFLRNIDLVYKERDHMVGHMKASGTDNAVDKVLQLIHTTVSSVERAEHE